MPGMIEQAGGRARFHARDGADDRTSRLGLVLPPEQPSDDGAMRWPSGIRNSRRPSASVPGRTARPRWTSSVESRTKYPGIRGCRGRLVGGMLARSSDERNGYEDLARI